MKSLQLQSCSMTAIFRRKNISPQSTVSVLRNSGLSSVPMSPPTFLPSHNFHTALFTNMLLDLHKISSAAIENYRQENNDLRFLEHNAICYNVLYTASQVIPNCSQNFQTYWIYNSYQVMNCINISIPRMIFLFKNELIKVIMYCVKYIF